NSRLHLPAFDQRSNRLKMVFQGPNSLGRSRHGTPVLRHHKTASTKLRLSFGGRFALRREDRFEPPPWPLVQLASNHRAHRWNTPTAPWKVLAVCTAISAHHRTPRSPQSRPTASRLDVPVPVPVPVPDSPI